MGIPLSLKMALLSCAVLGLRHGFDYDHIAAISDITSIQDNRRDSMRLGVLYALGHAATVAALGSAVIFFQLSLPAGIDRWAERLVGITLVVLAIYVGGSLVRGKSVAPKSRLMLLVSGCNWVIWKIRALVRNNATAKPPSFNWNYNPKSVFLVGIIHGLGAETPTQLVLFLLAANLGGIRQGFLGLTMFLAGLLVMNTLMTASATGLFAATAPRAGLMKLATAITAAYSFSIGLMFLFGSSNQLPALGSGLVH